MKTASLFLAVVALGQTATAWTSAPIVMTDTSVERGPQQLRIATRVSARDQVDFDRIVIRQASVRPIEGAGSAHLENSEFPIIFSHAGSSTTIRIEAAASVKRVAVTISGVVTNRAGVSESFSASFALFTVESRRRKK
jgi:hypothetical protein